MFLININNSKIILVLFAVFFSWSNFIFSQSVTASITIYDELEGELILIFERENSTSDVFFTTSINLGNNVRHKDPSSLNDKKNYLAGSWFNKEFKDLIIGVRLRKGQYTESVKIKLPEAIHDLVNNCFELIVKKSDYNIKNVFARDSATIYIPLKYITLDLQDKGIVEPEYINWKRTTTQNMTFSLDLEKENDGYLKYYRISFWKEFLKSYFWNILFYLLPAYLIKSLFVDDKLITKKYVYLIYFIMVIVSLLTFIILISTYGIYYNDLYTLYSFLILLPFSIVISLFVPNKWRKNILGLKSDATLF
jgi:hypothetical protein